MSRLLKAAVLGAGLALLIDASGALAQGGAGAAGGMRGTMGGARLDAAGVERLRRSLPQYEAGAEYAEGLAALKAQDFRRAAQAGDRLTNDLPGSIDGWRLLGAATAGEGDWKGSRRAYARIVKISPNDAHAHAGLGLALAHLQDGKAQTQLDWLRARAKACDDTCADTVHLRAFAGAVEDAMAAAAARSAPPAGA